MSVTSADTEVARDAAVLTQDPGPGLLRAAFAKWADPAALLDLPPMWREARVVSELTRLRRDPILRGDGVVPGDRRPILLVPGYMAGDSSMSVMADWLRRCGYRTGSSKIRFNVGCTTAGLEALERRLEALVERWRGEKAIVIGQSRGGMYGRLLAGRRPDLVSGLITLGSPVVDPLAVHPLLLINIGLMGSLGSLGVPGLLTRDCWSGECCTGLWEEAETPLDPDLRWTSVYSRSDGVVDWRSCLAPEAEHVEIDSTHFGMAIHPEGLRAVAAHLAAQPRVPVEAPPAAALAAA